MIKTLCTIDAIKAAVDAGHDVRCMGGGYQVIRDSVPQYLIKFMGSDYCIGLHGAEGTKYARKLNGSDFYYETTPDDYRASLMANG